MTDATNPYPAGGAEQPQPPGSGGYPGYPQGPQGPQGTRGPMAGYGQDDGKGFFGALFDFSFTSFVTPKIVKFVYVLATVAIGLGLLLFILTSFIQDPVSGVVVLIVGPILAVVYLAFIRMALEFSFALVRMSEDVHQRLPRI